MAAQVRPTTPKAPAEPQEAVSSGSEATLVVPPVTEAIKKAWAMREQARREGTEPE